MTKHKVKRIGHPRGTYKLKDKFTDMTNTDFLRYLKGRINFGNATDATREMYDRKIEELIAKYEKA